MRRLMAVVMCVVLSDAALADAAVERRAALAAPAGPGAKDAREILTDAAVVALIVAGSIALYKASGRPCACPEDTMRNGRACGDQSAYRRAGGARPLCRMSDITPGMIAAYRATKTIPRVD